MKLKINQEWDDNPKPKVVERKELFNRIFSNQNKNTYIKPLSQRSLALCDAQSLLPALLSEINKQLAPLDLLRSFLPTFHRTSKPSSSGKRYINNFKKTKNKHKNFKYKINKHF